MQLKIMDTTNECSLLKERIHALEASLLHNREQLNRSLEMGNSRFGSLFETMELGVIYYDENGLITLANPAAERLMGLRRSEILGRKPINPSWRTIHDDGSDFLEEQHPAMLALRTGKAVNETLMGIFQPLSHDFTWIIVNAMPEFRPGEIKPYRAYSTLSNFSSGRRAEQMVSGWVNELEIFISMTDMSSNSNYTLDQIYQEIVDQLPRFYLFGEDTWARIVIGKKEFGSTNSQKTVIQQTAMIWVNGSIGGLIEIGYPNLTPGINKAGFTNDELRLLESFAARVGILTERMQAEEFLRSSEVQFRRMVENSLDVFWLVDFKEKKINYVSPAIQLLTGYRAEELIHLSMRTIISEKSWGNLEKLWDENIHHFLNGEEIRHAPVQVEILCKDGSFVKAESQFKVIVEDIGLTVQIIGSSRTSFQSNNYIPDPAHEPVEGYRIYTQ